MATRSESIALGAIVGTLSVLGWRHGRRARLSNTLAFGLAWTAVPVLNLGLWNQYWTDDFLDVGYRTASILWQTNRAYIGVLVSPCFGLLAFMPAAAVGLGLLSMPSRRPIWLAMVVLVVMAVIDMARSAISRTAFHGDLGISLPWRHSWRLVRVRRSKRVLQLWPCV